MPKISKRFVIAAPAPAVWKVIGPGFARIGEWATAIRTSTGQPDDPGRPSRSTGSGLAAAPVTGRVCTTGLAIVPQVTETLLAYDDDGRSLTYEASGLPSFVTVARNTWTVDQLDGDTCVLTLDAQFDTRGVLGAVARWVLLALLGRTSRRLGEDLRHVVEHGGPSPAKKRQLQRTQHPRRPAWRAR